MLNVYVCLCRTVAAEYQRAMTQMIGEFNNHISLYHLTITYYTTSSILPPTQVVVTSYTTGQFYTHTYVTCIFVAVIASVVTSHFS